MKIFPIIVFLILKFYFILVLDRSKCFVCHRFRHFYCHYIRYCLTSYFCIGEHIYVRNFKMSEKFLFRKIDFNLYKLNSYFKYLDIQVTHQSKYKSLTWTKFDWAIFSFSNRLRLSGYSVIRTISPDIIIHFQV